MSGHLVLAIFCVAAAVLAAWLLVRFPSHGPSRPATVVAAAIAVAAGMALASGLFGVAVDAGRYGPSAGMLAVVLPMLTAAFWVSGCVMRTLAGAAGIRS